MITPKIKVLFQFIEYLHSNINNFNLNNDLIKELELLDKERQKVRSKKTFKDKLKYDEVQAEIETKFKILQGNTANPIKAKAKELNVCNFDNEPNYSFNGIETDIHELKENFSKDDLPEIFKHKQQYIEYRTKTHKTFLSLAFFIDELDEITKSLFDYFKETEQNEFEAFETKTIQVNDIGEAVELLSIGENKISVPINSKQPRNKPQFTTHEKLFEALIYSANEGQNKPITGAYEILKEVWFFLHSDSATFNGKDIEKYKRPLFINPVFVGKPEFDKFFEAEITYCSTQNKIALKEQDFVTDISNWIEQKSKDENLSIPRKRKCKEFLEYIQTKALPPQPIIKQKPEQETPKTFDELFYNTDLVKPCIDILKELDPPLIDTDCNYIGKLKGVFCVWIDEMQKQGIVKSNYQEERKLFASLIPTKINRFSIDESMFGKYQSKAENQYRTDIKTKVSNIKLSQNSQ